MLTLLPILMVLVSSCAASSPYHEAHFFHDRSGIVQMFEWRFDDVANECEQFLGPYKFAAVQISPVTEHSIFNESEVKYPWYQRYEPVSYKLDSRSGSRDQLQDMIKRCNEHQVRVYVDVVLNHMTVNLTDGTGSAGTEFDGLRKSYPGVPFGPENFHSCPSQDGIEFNQANETEVKNCDFEGLHDLDQSQEYVREKQAAMMNELIDMGVAGFRIDAAKHMDPADLTNIFSRLHNLNQSFFIAERRPFMYHHVIPGGVDIEAYKSIGKVVNFEAMQKLAEVFNKRNLQQLKSLSNFGSDWNLMKDEDSISMLDNHDVQRDQEYTLSFKNARLHKMANAFLLAWPYGMPKIMSSYAFTDDLNGRDEGPPHESDYTTKRVRFNEKDQLPVCLDGWVCEHRWRQVRNMVQFRNVAGDAPVSNWYDNGFQQIAFARKGRAFLVINNEDFTMYTTLDTGLPAGRYCDIVTGDMEDNVCRGETITVGEDGKALFNIDQSSFDGFRAIHVDAKLQ